MNTTTQKIEPGLPVKDFEKVFRVADGLGPIFNNNAGASCHPGDGRATSA